MRRRRLLIVAAAVLVIALAHFAYWRFLQRQLLAGYAQWSANARSAGWEVKAGSAIPGGWPFSADLTIGDFALSGGSATIPDGMTWRSPLVRLRISLLEPSRLVVDSQGTQHLRVGTSPDMPIAAERIHATLLLRSTGTPDAIDVLFDKLTAELAPGRVPVGRMTIGLLQAHADLIPGTAGTGFSLMAEAVDLPALVRWPLGPRLSSFAVEGTVVGSLGEGATRSEWATAWRDNGGSLEVRRMALGWGPLGVSATATLALDDQLQPMGAGTAKVIGYAATLDALAAGGALSRSAATAAKAVLSLLAPMPGDGEPAAVDVPLTLQYRTLSMRQVPLVRLPELDWPSP